MSYALSHGLGRTLKRKLARIQAAERRVSATELAVALFAMSRPPPRAVAKRLLATAFECPESHLSDAIDLAHLESRISGTHDAGALADTPVVVVDLETTGVSPARSCIIEIGALRVHGETIVSRFQTLIDPGTEIPPTITSLTGIDRESVEDAPCEIEALTRFSAWVGPGTTPLVAHNATFDAGFLDRAYRAQALPNWAGPVFCTRKLARRLLPDLGAYHLDALGAHFGLRNRARHRALGDAEVTARAWIELVGIARRRLACRGVGDYVDLLATPPAKLRRRLDRVRSNPRR